LETLASLRIKIDSSEAAPAAMGLDKVAAAGARAESQMEQTAAATATMGKGARSAAASAASLSSAVVDQERALGRAMASAAGLAVGHGKVAAAGKVTANEMLNLSRQFSDVAVTAAMGMNPLMILIQQGPQIADVFQTAAARGVGFSAVLKDIAASAWAAVAPFAPYIAAVTAVAAVVGGGLLVATHEANKAHKDFASTLGLTKDQLEKVKNKGITVGDVLSGTFAHVADSLKSSFASQLTWLKAAFESAMDGIAKGMTVAITYGVGAFSGGVAAIGKIFTTLPQIATDAAVSAANAMISAIESGINLAVNAINKLIAGVNEVLGRAGLKFQIPGLDPVNIAKLGNPAAGAMNAIGKAAGKAFDDGVKSSSQWLAGNNKFITDAAAKRIADEAGKGRKTADGPADDFNARAAAIDSQIAQAKASELSAQLGVTRDITARADIEHQILTAQLVAKDAQIQRQVEEVKASKGLTDTEKSLLLGKLSQLKALEGSVSAAQSAAIDERKADLLRKEALSVQTAQLQSQADVLSASASVATFNFQRTALEKQLLETNRQIARLALDDLIASKTATTAEKQIAQARLDALDQIAAAQPKVSEFEKRILAMNEVSSRVSSALESLSSAVKSHDWVGALSAAFTAIKDLAAAFKSSSTSAKVSAAASAAQQVGSAVGGTTGAALQSGASAASTAFALTGNPVIAAAAAVVSAIFGASAESKRQKQAKAAAAEQAKQAEAERQAQIAADKRSLEIKLMELSGDAAGALAATRADELKALDASNRSLQEQVYKLQDAKDAQDALNAKINDFYANWMTDAEKLAATQKGLSTSMAALGVSGVTTQAAFRSLVESVDTSSDAGKAFYSALLDLAPAFKQVTDNAQEMTAALIQSARDVAAAADEALKAAQGAVSDARGALKAAYDKEASAITARVNAAVSAVDSAKTALKQAYSDQSSTLTDAATKLRAFSSSIRDFRATLDSASLQGQGVGQQYSGARAALVKTAAAARGGDATARAGLQSAIETFLASSKVVSANAIAYQRDIAFSRAAIDDVATAADAAATTAEAQLATLKSQVSAIVDLTDQVTTVSDAIDALNAAIVDKALAERQLGALKDQVSGLIDVNESVKTVGQYITDLKASVDAQTAAQAAQAAAAQALAIAQAQSAAQAAAAQAASTQAAAAALAAVTAKAEADKAAAQAAADKAAAATALLSQWLDRDPRQFGGGQLYASGGVFTNGVVTKPTAFNNSMMGEAGPEAVMPLVMTSGGLGVRSSGGSSDVVAALAALREEVAGLRNDNSRTAQAAEKTARVLVRVTRDGETMQTTVS